MVYKFNFFKKNSATFAFFATLAFSANLFCPESTTPEVKPAEESALVLGAPKQESPEETGDKCLYKTPSLLTELVNGWVFVVAPTGNVFCVTISRSRCIEHNQAGLFSRYLEYYKLPYKIKFHWHLILKDQEFINQFITSFLEMGILTQQDLARNEADAKTCIAKGANGDLVIFLTRELPSADEILLYELEKQRNAIYQFDEKGIIEKPFDGGVIFLKKVCLNAFELCPFLEPDCSKSSENRVVVKAYPDNATAAIGERFIAVSHETPVC